MIQYTKSLKTRRPINSHHSKPTVIEDSRQEKDDLNNWYVFYTAPRAEKKVLKELSYKGYEVFLPITKTLRVWKNRQKKMVEQVLFPSYIFVNTKEKYLHQICQEPKVATFIHCAGKPSVIDFKCIEGIKRMLSLNQDVSVRADYVEGEHVRIICGPLMGYEGVLVEQKNKKRFGIQLKEINQTIFIDICTSHLEKTVKKIVKLEAKSF